MHFTICHYDDGDLLCYLRISHTCQHQIRLFAVMDTSSAGGLPGGAVSGADDVSLDDAGIVVFDTSMSAQHFTPAIRRTPHVLDAVGALPGCSSFMRDTTELVVGNDQGVFSYSADDRGGAAGLDGPKQCVGAVGR